MTTILPGYDFDIYEVPTRENFLRQANGLQISGIGVDSMSLGVLAVLAGEALGASDSIHSGSALAQLWISPTGDIWVRDLVGAAKLSRAEGGWETRRYYVSPHPTWGLARAGDPALVYEGALLGTPLFEDYARTQSDSTCVTDTVIVRYEDRSQAGSQANLYQGIMADTGNSGWRAWCGRGGIVLFNKTSSESTYERYCTINTQTVRSDNVSPAIATWQGERMTTPQDSVKHQAHILGITTGSSVVSDGNYNTLGHKWSYEYYGWNFGLLQMARKSDTVLT